jgi:hypothetical protein
LVGWLVGWLVGCLFGWLVGCLVGRLFVCLVGCVRTLRLELGGLFRYVIGVLPVAQSALSFACCWLLGRWFGGFAWLGGLSACLLAGLLLVRSVGWVGGVGCWGVCWGCGLFGPAPGSWFVGGFAGCLLAWVWSVLVGLVGWLAGLPALLASSLVVGWWLVWVCGCFTRPASF